jgi:hypothetical protein
LNIGFSIGIFICSSVEEHMINRYILGVFDIAEEQQTYLRKLALANAAFESAQRLNVILPDPPPLSPPAPTSVNKNETTAAIILGVLGFGVLVGVAGALLGFFFVDKKRFHAGAFIEDDSPLDISRRGMEVGVDLSQINLDEKGDVSSLGDPVQVTQRNTDQPSAADTLSLDYDFQTAYVGGLQELKVFMGSGTIQMYLLTMTIILWESSI